MAKRWWVLLIVGALAITGCQNCGSAKREAAEAAAKQAEEAAEAVAAEQEARAAAERAAAEEEARAAAEREAAAQAAAEAARTHTVVAGDCLWCLANDRWSDGYRWTEIHQANSDSIKDPDLIYPGQVLSMPTG